MTHFEVYKDVLGQYRWRLRSSNNRIIAVSGEGFVSVTTAYNSIQLIKQLALGARIIDKTPQAAFRRLAGR